MANIVYDVADGHLQESDDLSRRYRDWKQRYDITSKTLQKQFLFSPKWIDLWDQTWSGYDALERDRVMQKKDQESWMPKIIQRRREVEDLRLQRSEAPIPREFAQCPLWVCLDRSLGLDRAERSGMDWADALAAFKLFEITLQDSSQGLWPSLSRQQQVSWKLLKDWWYSLYQDKNLSDAAKLAIEDAASVCTASEGERYALQDSVSRKARTGDSLYHSWLFELFVKEFNPDKWEPWLKDSHLVFIDTTRKAALRHSYSQRVAFSFYLKTAKSLSTRQCKNSSYVENLSKPCPWLPRIGKKVGRPFYLWDVKAKATVVVDNLEEIPDYLCISHTWGRWRKEPKIPVHGVPWLVPQNTRFEVARLPDDLQRIQPPCPYVWLDLFCIPQDGSAKADEEIARQASIFQCSTQCLAWLNDAKSWHGVAQALDWISALYLRHTSREGVYETDRWISEAAARAGSTVELTKPIGQDLGLAPEIERYMREAHLTDQSLLLDGVNTHYEPTVWFSSLWTLQEAALCPHLLLVNREWEILSDAADVPIPLNTLLMVASQNYPFVVGKSFEKPGSYEPKILRSPKWDTRSWLRWPTGAMQLHLLCIQTRMDQILSLPSPSGLLIMGNLRQSTDSRAPAIMSALGVTDWYLKAETRRKNSLVFDLYPLAFVREAAAKIGAVFFSAMSGEAHQIPATIKPLRSSAVGSMMPFSNRKGWYSHIEGIPDFARISSKDHPAVRTWTINADTSVTMKQAGIIAASDRTYSGKIVSTVMIGNIGKKVNKEYFDGDIRDWFQQIDKCLSTYAVMLFEDALYQFGIILQGHQKQFSLTSTKRLVKTGTFFTHLQPTPEAEDVNWVVL